MAEVTRITERYFLCNALKNKVNLGLYHTPMAG